MNGPPIHIVMTRGEPIAYWFDPAEAERQCAELNAKHGAWSHVVEAVKAGSPMPDLERE